MSSRGYIICCLQRTGSNFLADALRRTGVAGVPREHFNPTEQSKPWIRSILGEDTMVTGFPKIVESASTPNGVFGTKLLWVHIRNLTEALAYRGTGAPPVDPNSYMKLLAQFPDLMPTEQALRQLTNMAGDRSRFLAVAKLFQSHISDLRFVWLRRQNMVARAISHYRAIHTDKWHADSNSPHDADRERPPLEFNLAEIHKHYYFGLFQDQSWQWYFGALGVTPHIVIYEELVADYSNAVRGILEFLDVEMPGGDLAAPGLVQQADASSQEWELRFRRESEQAGL